MLTRSRLKVQGADIFPLRTLLPTAFKQSPHMDSNDQGPKGNATWIVQVILEKAKKTYTVFTHLKTVVSLSSQLGFMSHYISLYNLGSNMEQCSRF